MNMLENLPLEVQKELSFAISGIGNVIAETNHRLAELGFRDYAAVAGSLFYNDPDQFCDVPCLSLVVYPLTEERGSRRLGFRRGEGGNDRRDILACDAGDRVPDADRDAPEPENVYQAKKRQTVQACP
jgi:hypothetical protein